MPESRHLTVSNEPINVVRGTALFPLGCLESTEETKITSVVVRGVGCLCLFLKLDVPVVASALCSPFRLIIFEVSGCVVHGLHETAVNSAPHQQGIPPSFSEEKKKRTRPLRLPGEFVGSNSEVVWLLRRAWRSALRRILLWMTDHVNALRLG